MYKLHLQEISNKVYCIFIIGVPNDTYKYDINNLNLSEKKIPFEVFTMLKILCVNMAQEKIEFFIFLSKLIFICSDY